jgi:hypothetical protein
MRIREAQKHTDPDLQHYYKDFQDLNKFTAVHSKVKETDKKETLALKINITENTFFVILIFKSEHWRK